MATNTTELPTSVPFLEFSDYGDIPADLDMHQLAQGEVVRESSVIEYCESGYVLTRRDELFQVILHDKRVFQVLGHSVEFIPSGVQSDSGSYAIVSKTGGTDHYVAMFPASQLIGIFAGQIVSAS
jgi:hypothetical protein